VITIKKYYIILFFFLFAFSAIAQISVEVSPDTWSMGSVAINTTSDWSVFTATNTGSVILNFTIKGTDGTGGWSIQTIVDTDTFVIEVDDPSFNITTEEQPLASGINPAAVYGFCLKYKSPTLDTKGAGIGQGLDITITASETE